MNSREQPQDDILRSLTRLMVDWSSLLTQSRIAREAGVVIEAKDIQPLYALGLSGPVRASALADDLRLTRPTMSKQLARLEAAGLVSRRADAGDGRAAIVSLTASGQSVYDRLVRRGVDLVHDAIREWPQAQTSHFAALLASFMASLTGMTGAAEDEQPASAPSDSNLTRERDATAPQNGQES